MSSVQVGQPSDWCPTRRGNCCNYSFPNYVNRPYAGPYVCTFGVFVYIIIIHKNKVRVQQRSYELFSEPSANQERRRGGGNQLPCLSRSLPHHDRHSSCTRQQLKSFHFHVHILCGWAGMSFAYVPLLYVEMFIYWRAFRKALHGIGRLKLIIR